VGATMPSDHWIILRDIILSHGCDFPLVSGWEAMQPMPHCVLPIPTGSQEAVCVHLSPGASRFFLKKNLSLDRAGQGVLPICLFKMAIWGEKEESMGEERGWG
jgi:hypothetical protein